MKKIFAIFLVIVAVVGCVGFLVVEPTFCISAKSKVKHETTVTDANGTVTRVFNPKSFDEIDVDGPIEVVFIQGKQTPVVVTGRQLEMDHLEVAVKGSTLDIKLDKEYFRLKNISHNDKKKRVTVKLSAPNLSKINMSVSSSFKADVITQSGDLEIDAATSALIDVRRIECGDLSVDVDTTGAVEIGSVKVKALEADADTSGSIRINGVADTSVFKADTSGYIKVNKLTTPSFIADVDTSGSVRVEVLFSENAVGRANTSGSIILKGKAKTADFKAETGGSIKAKAFKVDLANIKTSTGGKIGYYAKKNTHDNPSQVNAYNGD